MERIAKVKAAIRLAGITVLLCGFAIAQTGQTAPTSPASSSAAHSAVKTPPAASSSAAASKPNEDKLKWCREVKSVAGGAAGLEPGMRSYVLTTAASGLKQCDPTLVQATLTDAFRATLAMTEENRLTQGDLQFNSLSALSHISEPATESLVGQALPTAQGGVLSELVDRAATARKFDRALDLLHRIPAEGFPYGSANKLMDAMPAGREADRLGIFRSALAADQAPQSGQGFNAGADFADLIRNQWKHVPHDLALEAIHQVLDKAKASDADPKNDFGFNFNFNGKAASFNKLYDFKLVQLLGVLRTLDSEEADRRIKDSDSLQKTAQDFPNGLPTPGAPPPEGAQRGSGPGVTGGTDDGPHKNGGPGGQPGAGDGSGEDNVSLRVSSTGDDAAQASQFASEATQRATHQRYDEIAAQVDDNPKQALTAALSLPETEGDSHPRQEALLRIGRAAKVKHPTAARDALQELAKLGKDQEPGISPEALARNPWADALVLAAELKESELGKKLLAIGLDQADKLKAKDADSDDPNQALKAWWPSTNMAQKMVAAAGKLSPQLALAMAQEMQDPDWQLLSRLRLANEALGASKGEIRTEVHTKHNEWSSVQQER